MDVKKEVYVYTPYRASMIWFTLIYNDEVWKWNVPKKVQIKPTFLAVSFVYLGIFSPLFSLC